MEPLGAKPSAAQRAFSLKYKAGASSKERGWNDMRRNTQLLMPVRSKQLLAEGGGGRCGLG